MDKRARKIASLRDLVYEIRAEIFLAGYDCSPSAPNQNATYHSSGEVIGLDFSLGFDREKFRCEDCGKEWFN